MKNYSRPLAAELYRRQPRYIQEKLAHQLQHVNDSRGRQTRGWLAASPKRGHERHVLRKTCGDKCFLLPGQEKFPICPSCLDPTCNNCIPDCRGIAAAKIRAAQYHYENVYQRALQLEKEYGC